MVGGVKLGWRGPVVGGGRRLMVDGIATCGVLSIAPDQDGALVSVF